MQIIGKTRYCDGLPSLITLKTTSGDVYISVENIEERGGQLCDEEASLLGDFPEEFASEVAYLSSLDITDVEEDMENGVDFAELEFSDYDGSKLTLLVRDDGEGVRAVSMSYENIGVENGIECADKNECAAPNTGPATTPAAANYNISVQNDKPSDNGCDASVSSAEAENAALKENTATSTSGVAGSENAVRDMVAEQEMEARLASMGRDTKWGARPGKAESDKIVMTEPKTGLVISIPEPDIQVDITKENNGYSLDEFTAKEQEELMQLAEQVSMTAAERPRENRRMEETER